MKVKNLLKPACFIAAVTIILLGPQDVFHTSYQEEQIHIIVSLLLFLGLLIFKLTPNKPKTENIKPNCRKSQISELKKQLKYQIYMLQNEVPFDFKKAKLKLILNNPKNGAKELVKNLYEIKTPNMPYRINWYHDQNSIICLLSTEILPGEQAQHTEHLYSFILTFLTKKFKKYPFQKAFLIIDVKELALNSVSKCMDAYNYVISSITNKTKTVPLKIIITKCDQIAGFTPYFEHLGKAAKKENWQISFVCFDRHSFNQKYDHLVAELNSQMVSKMHTEAQLYRRILIKDFPIQIEKLRNSILENLQHLNNRSEWQIRSLAFSSATQDGSYFDLVNQKMDITKNIEQKQLMIVKQRYFCDDLLTSGNYPNINQTYKITSEIWFQATTVTFTLVVFLLTYQGIWLQRFFDMYKYQISNLEQPKILLERDARLWQSLYLSQSMSNWIAENPIPKYLGKNLWQNNVVKINNKLIARINSIPNCENAYSCLAERWQAFIEPKTLATRMNWLNNNKLKLSNMKFTPQKLEQVRTEILQDLLQSKAPQAEKDRLIWLKKIKEIIVSKSDQNLKASIPQLQQMIDILELENDGLKSFNYLGKFQKNIPNNLPEKFAKISEEINKKFKENLISHINTVWQNTVLKFYQNRLIDKYPFNQQSTNDAKIEDVKKLFAMKDFFIKYYFEPAEKIELKPRLDLLRELNLAGSFLNDMRLEFSVSAKKGIKSDVSIAEINIAGSLNNLKNKSLPMFHWPLYGQDDTIGIWLQNKAGRMAMTSRHGTWGLFRLIQASGSVRTGSREVELKVPVGEQNILLSIYLSKPWANLNPKIPDEIV